MARDCSALSPSIDHMAPSCEFEKQNTSTVLLSQFTKIACELLSSSLWSHHQFVPVLVRFTLRGICLSVTEKSGRGTGERARSVENDFFFQPPATIRIRHVQDPAPSHAHLQCASRSKHQDDQAKQGYMLAGCAEEPQTYPGDDWSPQPYGRQSDDEIHTIDGEPMPNARGLSTWRFLINRNVRHKLQDRVRDVI